MVYTARYRFKILSALKIDVGAQHTAQIAGLPPVLFEVDSEAFPMGHWITARMRDFASEIEAEEAGRRLGNALRIAGAIHKIGIDIGFDRSTLQFSRSFQAQVEAASGRSLLTDTHGLMTYRTGTVNIVGLNARGSSLFDPKVFSDYVAQWVPHSAKLSERQINCAALLNDSFFVPHIEGQFLLRVSAVEALCDQTVRDPEYQRAVTELQRHLSTMDVADDARETIGRMLTFAGRESLRQAYMGKFRTLLSAADAKAYDKLYGIRSKLVHQGQGRGELLAATDEALTLAVNLLAADIAAS